MPLDHITDFILGRLYEDDYDRRMYFRLYNVEIPESPFDLPGGSARLERLEDWQICEVTGETTITSTLHLAKTGNVFLVTSESNADDDITWGRARWEEASALLGVLKYLRYGIVEIDYSAILFSPAWLNNVRRYGIPLWGRPRTDIQIEHYILRREDEHLVGRYLAAGFPGMRHGVGQRSSEADERGREAGRACSRMTVSCAWCSVNALLVEDDLLWLPMRSSKFLLFDVLGSSTPSTISEVETHGRKG
jgi:hypothetical protein